MPREVGTCPAVAWLDVNPVWPHLAPTVFNPCAAGVLCRVLLPDPLLRPVLFLRKFFSFSNFVDERCSETKLDAGVCARQAWPQVGPLPNPPAQPPGQSQTACLPASPALSLLHFRASPPLSYLPRPHYPADPAGQAWVKRVLDQV